jgi:hypothetical protein
MDALRLAFEQAYLRKNPASMTKAGAGRKGPLASIEQKSLFALVNQKGYALQSVGVSFLE